MSALISVGAGLIILGAFLASEISWIALLSAVLTCIGSGLMLLGIYED